MELTGSQKRRLRSQGHRLGVAMSLGKGGLSVGVVAALKELLTRNELLKVRLPALPPRERESLARELAGAVGAVVAGAVGRTVLLYKFNETLPQGERIVL